MKHANPFKDHREHLCPTSSLMEWFDSIIFALILVMVFNLGFRIVNVNGPSMAPTLATNDRLIITNICYQPKVGDIIVSVQDNERHEPVIKRIIALEGQTVDINYESGIVYVDGQPTDDSYTAQPGFLEKPFSNYKPMEMPCVVPEGCVFVMGDNRNNSLDSRSRSIGMIDQRYILGKAVYRIFPFERMGSFGETK